MLVVDSVRAGRLLNMELPNLDQLKFLLQRHERYCVSVFSPTHRAGTQTRQDPIRLKNVLKEAESRLIALGEKSTKVREVLAPGRELVQRSGFWRQQQDGLALFLSNGLFNYFRVPLRLQELVSVSETFEVSPLLPLFTMGGHFYVLAISRNHVRFFRMTATTFDELNVPGIPHSVDEALKYDVRESQLQLHSGAGGRELGKESAVFTGQGIGVDDEQEHTHEFLLMVERGIRRFLRDERAPLVLAAVRELASAYRAVNKYPTLLEETVTGNPDLTKPQELHGDAWKLAEPYFQRDRERALATYPERAAAGEAASDVKGALAAARQGRIETVFLPTGEQRWGKVDLDCEDTLIEVHEKQEAGDVDPYNIIAMQTILHRGKVYMVEPATVANGSAVAAILRY